VQNIDYHPLFLPAFSNRLVFASSNGTCTATPFVSALAAILFDYSNNAATVRNQLETTAPDVSPTGPDLYTGAGLIQMDAAIRRYFL